MLKKDEFWVDQDLVCFVSWRQKNGKYYARCRVLNCEESFRYLTLKPEEVPNRVMCYIEEPGKTDVLGIYGN